MKEYRRLVGRGWSPMWLAFTSTAAAALFLIAGSTGYILDKRARFFAGASWSGTVIWWEVGVGIALVPVAVYFWRRGFREVDRQLGRA